MGGQARIDLVVSALVIVVGMPLWLAIAAAIKLSSRGPVFYRDPRIGLGEQTFGMIKFRTMVAGAAEQQAELERRTRPRARSSRSATTPASPGRQAAPPVLARRAPNMLNVIRGQMSLVGPRPLPLRDHALLEDWHRKRSNVLPGMTGLWQISGRSDLSFDDLVRLDFYYLENWSIWLDISILAKTAPP